MSENSGNLTTNKPVPWYKRDVTFDPKALFKAFSEAAMDLADGQRVSAGKKIFDAISAGSLEDDTTGLGWLLVTKSLAAAAARIAAESREHFGVDPKTTNLEHLNQDLNDFFKETEIEITPDFLDHPQRLPIIEDMKGLLKKWLSANEMDSNRVETAIQRLNDYFVLELDIEWRRGQADYHPLEALLSSPFKPAADMNRAWISYNVILKENLREPLFGIESFDITQIYVPLRAYYEIQEKKTSKQRSRDLSHAGDENRPTYQAIRIHQYLHGWVNNGITGDKNSMKVITGGPGSGKSTFVKYFAAEVSEKDQIRVLCVQLHNFNMGGDFKNGLSEYLKDKRWFDENPLDSEESRPLLIILDGLDELPLQYNEALENARQFVQHIKTFLSRYQGRRLFILITGRTLVVESNLREWPEKEQVLHLLPYTIRDRDFKNNCTPQDLLEKDQRDEWWKRYGEVTGLSYTGLPPELSIAGEKVDDLTAQPLLNYLVALTLKDGEIDFSTQPNIAVIYDDLLRQIYQGIHNKDRISPLIQDLDKIQFETLLQEVAVAVWHGNSGRSTTFGQIKNRCEKCNMHQELEAISQDTSTGLLRLLAAFYFRQYGGVTQENKTIEFTHKSFYEYLVAKRVVEEIRTFQQQFELMQKNPRIAFTNKEALRKWCELCGPCEFDEDLLSFLVNLIRLESDENIDKWQGMLIGLFNFMLDQGMPMEQIDGGLTYQEMAERSANAEETLLAGISACADITDKPVEIEWRGSSGFGQWLQRIQGQKGNSFFTVGCFSRQQLSNQRLSFAILRLGHFLKADLQGADLQGANLQGADLREASLQGADLRGADLLGAYLRGAYLRGAYLRETNFKDASGLSVSQLSQAKTLYKAKLDPELEAALKQQYPHLFEHPIKIE